MGISPVAERRTQRGFISSWPAYLLTVLVVLAALYAFAPRSHPPAPPTRVHADDLLVTGLAHRGSRWLAAGEQGRILIADSAEGPWREAKVTPQRASNFTAVIFVDDRTALAVGHDSWIVRSEDGGESWSEAMFDPERSEPLLGIAGPYDGTLFTYGGFGQFLTSADAGKTWTRTTHEVLGDKHLNGMTRLDDGTLLVVGERGLMATSCDRGLSWGALPEIYAGSFFGVLALPDNRALVFGMRGNAYVSNDLQSWTRSTLPEAVSLFGGTTDTSGSITLVGENGAVLNSTDGGAHFTAASGGERQRLAAVLPAASGSWLVGGESGVSLKRRADAGAKS